MKTLSAKQLQVLGSLSRRAYKTLAARGHVQEMYEEWRRTFTADVTGRASWRALCQQDYIPLVNALRGIIGMPPVEDNTPADQKASLAWTVKDRAQFWELRLHYVQAIVADKFHLPQAGTAEGWDEMLAMLDTQQMKQLLYTIEARGRKRSNKSAEVLDIPAPTEMHTSRSTMPPARLAEYRGDRMVDGEAKPRRKARRGKAEVCAR